MWYINYQDLYLKQILTYKIKTANAKFVLEILLTMRVY